MSTPTENVEILQQALYGTYDERYVKIASFNTYGDARYQLQSEVLEPQEWVLPSLSFTKISTSSFSVSGDHRDIYYANRQVRVNMTGTVTIAYAKISTSTYSSPDTTIVLDDTIITDTLVSVEFLRDSNLYSMDASDYGTTLDDVTINAALTDIGSDETNLILEPKDWLITDDISFPSTLTVSPEVGCKLKIRGDCTLTFAGTLKALPNQKIFAKYEHTTVKTTAVAGAVDIDVNTIVNLLAGYDIWFELDSGSLHYAKIDSIIDSDTIRIDTAVPTGDAISANTIVYTMGNIRFTGNMEGTYTNWFSPSGGGTEDDTAFIQKHADSVTTKLIPFKTLSTETYRITRQLDLRKVYIIDCQAEILVDFTTDCGVLVGGNCQINNVGKMFFYKVIDNDTSEVPTYPIMRITGLSSSKMTIGQCNYLQLYCENNGGAEEEKSIMYTKFDLGIIRKLEIYDDGTSTDTPYSINENTFYNGRIRYLIVNGSYNHNGNKFFDPCLEGDDAVITFNVGHSNMIQRARFETTGTVTITFDAGTHDNIITQDYVSDFTFPATNPLPSNVDVIDNGTANLYYQERYAGYSHKLFLNISRNTTMFGNGTDTTINIRGIDDLDNSLVPGLDYLYARTTYRRIWDSGIIPAHEGDMYKFICDADILRTWVYAFDSNKQLLTTEASSTSEIRMSDKIWYNGATQKYWTQTADATTIGVALENLTNVAYIRILLRTGATVSNEYFRYILGYSFTKHKRDYEYDATIGIMYKAGLALSSSPTQGYAQVGETVYKTDGTVRYTNIFSLDTKTNAEYDTVSTIGIEDITDINKGDIVGIELKNGTTYWTTLSSTPTTGTSPAGTITLTSALTTVSRNQARIVFNRWLTV